MALIGEGEHVSLRDQIIDRQVPINVQPIIDAEKGTMRPVLDVLKGLESGVEKHDPVNTAGAAGGRNNFLQVDDKISTAVDLQIAGVRKMNHLAFRIEHLVCEQG
jgi:hypothetical protein